MFNIIILLLLPASVPGLSLFAEPYVAELAPSRLSMVGRGPNEASPAM